MYGSCLLNNICINAVVLWHSQNLILRLCCLQRPNFRPFEFAEKNKELAEYFFVNLADVSVVDSKITTNFDCIRDTFFSSGRQNDGK